VHLSSFLQDRFGVDRDLDHVADDDAPLSKVLFQLTTKSWRLIVVLAANSALVCVSYQLDLPRFQKCSHFSGQQAKRVVFESTKTPSFHGR
jgi:hypothetical protein